jgi:hypothetical protein
VWVEKLFFKTLILRRAKWKWFHKHKFLQICILSVTTNKSIHSLQPTSLSPHTNQLVWCISIPFSFGWITFTLISSPVKLPCVGAALLSQPGVRHFAYISHCSNENLRLGSKQNKKNSMAFVCEWTIPTERPPLVGEVSANLCGWGCHVVSTMDPHIDILYYIFFIWRAISEKRGKRLFELLVK